MAGGWGWVGLLDEDMMESGGRGVAMVMRVEHAMPPLLHSGGGHLTEGWEDGRRGGGGGGGGGVQYYLLLLDMAY